MSARNEILAKVRKSVETGGSTQADRRAEIERRLAQPVTGVIPERGQLSQAARVDLFLAEAERVSTEVTRLASYAELPACVADFLRNNNLPQRIRHGDE